MPDRSTLENKAVEAYLQYLATGEVPVDPDLQDKLDLLAQQIEGEARLYVKVQLIAKRRELDKPPDPARLIERFIEYAPTFSERLHIDYATWREMGVQPGVLKQAGIKGANTHAHGSLTGGQSPHSKPRHKRDAAFAIAVFQLYMTKRGWEGRTLVAEQYNYRDENAVTNVLADLSAKFPQEAATCGYVHKDETITRDEALARAHEASKKAS